MKYRIYYYDIENEAMNNYRDFDSLEKLLDFIADRSYVAVQNYDKSFEVDENDSFTIHNISEIEEKIIYPDLTEAKERGKKIAIENEIELEKKRAKIKEDNQRLEYEFLKKKFEK